MLNRGSEPGILFGMQLYPVRNSLYVYLFKPEKSVNLSVAPNLKHSIQGAGLE